MIHSISLKPLTLTMDSFATSSFPIPVSFLVTAIAALLISLFILRWLLLHSRRMRRVSNQPFQQAQDLSHSNSLRQLCLHRGSCQCGGNFNYEVMSDFLGDGIFAVDGEKWRQQRKVASYEFSTKVLRDYSSLTFKNSATRLTKIISELVSSNQVMDIQDLLMKSGLDSIFKVGFGVELGVLSGLEEGKAFSNAFNEASCQILYRYFDVFWKFKRYLNVGSEAKMKKNIQLIDDFVYRVIGRKTKQLAKKGQDILEKEDILSRFLQEKEKPSGGIDNKYLRDIILNFMIAGRDTTAGTLSWFFYMLCKHPSIQDKIAIEVQKATQMQEGKITSNEFGNYLTEDAINDMQYLHAALTETLRLYPAVPIEVKYCFFDDTLPDGFCVNKGDLVSYQPYPMGRMKFLWGDDAYEFRPERWLNEGGIFVPESPFKFTAFQAGPRICLGKEFAYRQMKIVAATLLYFFKFEMWDSSREVRSRTMLTLQIDGGLHLRVMHR
ncbi:Cytochrome P450 family protein [Rhynchospora pubera]|uniref:Cytochrome P450 family protein n=1 Tax=Rhynchospora pubera TaxID=906938 RepID=A0AAV8GA46_9POAL|nr:Cytochrome P450 family protein [Rhynchospora pubera]